MVRGCILLLYDVVLIRLAIEDYRKRTICDKYNGWILILTGISLFLDFGITPVSRVVGMLLISIPMSVIALWKPGSFGGGDVKLSFTSGAFLGAKGVLYGTCYGIVFAGVYCIWRICTKRENKNDQFALGPYLSIGYLLVTLNLI